MKPAGCVTRRGLNVYFPRAGGLAPFGTLSQPTKLSHSELPVRLPALPWRYGVGTIGIPLFLVTACGHSEPLSTRPTRLSGPYQPGAPLRLTYNIGADTHAAWSDDGSLIYYSAQDSFTVDKDRCIVAMPAAGGTRITWDCPSNPANDTTQILDQPAPLGALLAYSSSELGINEHSQFRHAIWLTANAPFTVPRAVVTFPYTSQAGLTHNAPLYLQWLRPGILLYLGAENGCCRKDTLRFGQEAVLVDVTANPPVRTYLAGTTKASAVSAASDGLSIYYTFYGDSRVYQQVLGTGQVTVTHDFGSGRIVRDPVVVGDRLVAIVDGLPRYWERPPLGFVQVDYGGLITVVDLNTGQETLVPDGGRLYKRPRLSPDGQRLVVEGYPFTLSATLDSLGQPAIDTVVSKWADLWLLEEN